MENDIFYKIVHDLPRKKRYNVPDYNGHSSDKCQGDYINKSYSEKTGTEIVTDKGNDSINYHLDHQALYRSWLKEPRLLSKIDIALFGILL